MFGSFSMSVKEIRSEMGISQSELAAMVGIGIRSIQSYEQGWRQPSEMVRRMLLLLLITHRNGAKLSGLCCWKHKECSPEVRSKCIAYVTLQGHLCWFLTGTMCEGVRQKTWDDKLNLCFDCSFMKDLLNPVASKAKPAVMLR